MSISALEFLNLYGSTVVRKICAEAGTTYAYFQHVAKGRKRFGIDLAHSFSVISSRYATRGHEIEVASLRPLRSITKTQAKRIQQVEAGR